MACYRNIGAKSISLQVGTNVISLRPGDEVEIIGSPEDLVQALKARQVKQVAKSPRAQMLQSIRPGKNDKPLGSGGISSSIRER